MDAPPIEASRAETRPVPRLPWIVAAVAVTAFCAVSAYLVTDGDSCVYGALARQMARGTWRAWVAPRWAFAGAVTCFHEHPPGSFWPAALLGLAGLAPTAALLAGNALWALAAAAGTVALARRLGATAAAALVAGGVLLLHVSPLRYAGRGSLEFPFAACSAWTVVAALRLQDGRRWAALLAAALAGAFVTRGVFAGVAAAVVCAIVVEPTLRPPLPRLAAGVVGAALLLVVFDRLHDAATGHGFWRAYLERQVLPSLEEGGSRHSSPGLAVAYYLPRALVYSLPWVLLPLWRVVQRIRGGAPLGNASAWRLAALWIVLAVVGPSLTSRQASRYLFQAWVPASVLFALSLPAAFAARPGRTRTLLAWCVPLIVPFLSVGKTVISPSGPAYRTAELLDSYRAAHAADPAPPRPVRGPFEPDDDSHKSLLWFHLDRFAHTDVPAAPRDADIWVPLGAEPPPSATTLVATPTGRLVAPPR